MYAVIYSDGELKSSEIFTECKTGKWIPLLFIQEKNEKTKSIVCFKDAVILEKFIKRNIPKNWIRGCLTLVNEDIDWVKSQGWDIKILDFPRKLINNTSVEVSFEILEFQTGEPIVKGIAG